MSSCECFFFKQETAYEMRISDWSSDVCSSDLLAFDRQPGFGIVAECFGGAVLRPQPAGLREGAGIFALGIIRAGDERTIATPAQRQPPLAAIGADRKSTRLNSSH